MHPNQEAIDAAIKRRDDWLESLPIDQRVKARAYQHELEQKAKVHPDGMMGMITDELANLTHQLLDVLAEAKTAGNEHVAKATADMVIGAARMKK